MSPSFNESRPQQPRRCVKLSMTIKSVCMSARWPRLTKGSNGRTPQYSIDPGFGVFPDLD